jgi:hypothetical protein
MRNVFEESRCKYIKLCLADYLGFGVHSDAAVGFGKGEGGDTVDAMDGGIEDGGHDAGNGGLPSFKFAGFSNDAFHAEMDRRAEFVRHQAAEMERLDAQMKRRQAAGNF